MAVGDWVNEKVLPPVLKFVNTRPIVALKNGMMVVMPLTIIGAVFLLIGNLPFPGWIEWLEGIGLYPVIMSVYVATFNLLGLVACIGIAYNFVKAEGYEGLPAAVYAACMMVMVMPQAVLIDDTSDATVGNVIPMDWTGAKGMIGGILVAIFVGYVYTWFLKRDITIKMPEGVPPNVATAFTSLIPGLVVLTCGAVLFGIFRIWDTTLVEAIYNMVQTPLSGMTDSLPGVIAMSFVGPFLWFFGVHGSSIVSGIMSPILLANTAHNQAIIDSGQELTVANGGKIVTMQFLDNFIIMTGAGVTIGLLIYMLVFAKSGQFKMLGKLSIGPGLFNINEPIIFGTPIVMNPLLAVPFFLTPMLLAVFQYLWISIGFAPLYTGVLAPWTTPPIVSGLIIGGWRTALMQLIGLLISVAMYYPFALRVDRMQYRQQLALQESGVEGHEEAAEAASAAVEAEVQEAQVAAEEAEIGLGKENR